MELNIKKLENNDYENILVNWWNNYNWTPPPKNFLPDNGSGGFIVYNDITPICAGFIYKTNSKVAWVDWIISNKEYRKKPERTDAIGLLIETLTNICRNKGAKYCYALIKHKGLIKTYKELGYTQADSYTSEMIKTL